LDETALPGQWDQDTWPDQKARIAEVVRGRSLAEWREVYDGTDACVTPVLTRQEAAGHPHFAQRGVFEDRDGALWPGPAPRFSTTPGAQSPATESGDLSAVLAEAGVEQSVIQEVLDQVARPAGRTA
jgi:alpha-methylacyl-CoA racemase